MKEQIDIWLVGNTGLRNPNRIQDGFKVFAGSPFVGNLHGKDNEIGFMNLLNEKGIIQNEEGKDESGSHARKWRLMFAKNGFIYPQIKKKDGMQEDLGPVDNITPFGRMFLKADTYAAVQECYLRAMSVEQFPMPDGKRYFSPLRWLLAIMLELEKRTGSSELSRIEFALWGIQQIRVIIFRKLSIIFLILEDADLLLLRNALLIEKKLLNAENIMTKSLTISWITVT